MSFGHTQHESVNSDRKKENVTLPNISCVLTKVSISREKRIAFDRTLTVNILWSGSWH